MKKKPPSSRALQAQRTKEKIFQTAVRMIAQHGFDNVTVNDICTESGVATGSFYHYFKSKDDIIILTYENVDKSYEIKLDKLPDETTTIDKIIFTVMFQARYAAHSGVEGVRQIYRSQMEYGTTFFLSEDRPIFRSLREIIADGQQKNEIRSDLSAEFLTNFVLSIARGVIYDWCTHNGSYNLEKMMKSYFSLLVKIVSVPIK